MTRPLSSHSRGSGMNILLYFQINCPESLRHCVVLCCTVRETVRGTVDPSNSIRHPTQGPRPRSSQPVAASNLSVCPTAASYPILPCPVLAMNDNLVLVALLVLPASQSASISSICRSIQHPSPDHSLGRAAGPV
jgi:hypothetical protein